MCNHDTIVCSMDHIYFQSKDIRAITYPSSPQIYQTTDIQSNGYEPHYIPVNQSAVSCPNTELQVDVILWVASQSMAFLTATYNRHSFGNYLFTVGLLCEVHSIDVPNTVLTTDFSLSCASECHNNFTMTNIT